MGKNKYADVFKAGGRNEAHFVLGVDLGNVSSAIAYFDLNRGVPETLDVSGGYGKPAMPTTMQYLSDTREWIYGEYALNPKNNDNDINITGLVAKLGNTEYLEINGAPVSNSQLLAQYLKELIGNCKNINPKAEIAGITAAVPSHMSESAKDDLLAVFRKAGYSEVIFPLTDDRECTLTRYFYGRDLSDETVLLLDFGAREMRGGIYSVSVKRNNLLKVESLSSVFDKNLGTNLIHDGLFNFFTRIYSDKMKISPENIGSQNYELLENFTNQHKDVLFQKMAGSGSAKVYFNFSYPPFEVNIDSTKVEEIISPFRLRMEEFMRNVFSKTTSRGDILPSAVTTVICCGGGFEMLWARNYLKRMFGEMKVFFFKNSTTAAAEGASLMTAAAFGLAKIPAIEMVDYNRLKFDIGVQVIKNDSPRFIPLIERNSFWWQEQDRKSFVLADKAEGLVTLDILKRGEDGKVNKLSELPLSGLPKRPAGATRLSLGIEFLDALRFVAIVKDLGFGEIYPKTSFEAEHVMELKL